MGVPSASTTRPMSASPTGTDTTLPVRVTLEPSFTPSSLPSMTTATEFSSKFSAMPYTPVEKRISSLAMHFSSPETRAMPSPTRSTVPTSSCTTFCSYCLICCLMIFEISSGLNCISIRPPFLRFP